MTDTPDEPLLVMPLPVMTARADGPYTFIDRYRDFNRTFETEHGKRVLSQILRALEAAIPHEDAPHCVMAAYVSRVRMADWLKRVLLSPPRDIADA